MAGIGVTGRMTSSSRLANVRAEQDAEAPGSLGRSVGYEVVRRMHYVLRMRMGASMGPYRYPYLAWTSYGYQWKVMGICITITGEAQMEVALCHR